MRSLTLKNIPDQLYARLKAASRAEHRSMNGEILYCLEQVFGSRKTDVNERLVTARMMREKTSDHWLTDDELNAMKEAGRP